MASRGQQYTVSSCPFILSYCPVLHSIAWYHIGILNTPMHVVLSCIDTALVILSDWRENGAGN